MHKKIEWNALIYPYHPPFIDFYNYNDNQAGPILSGHNLVLIAAITVINPKNTGVYYRIIFMILSNSYNISCDFNVKMHLIFR